MKKMYDKHATPHTFSAGDYVMLWDPYYRKGVSRSFQAKWQGPWIIMKLIGAMNCLIKNENGDEKNVHLNQLKKIEKRNSSFDPGTHSNLKISDEIKRSESNEEIDPSIFETIPDMCIEPQIEEQIQREPRINIDNAYVDLNASNIIENMLQNRIS